VLQGLVLDLFQSLLAAQFGGHEELLVVVLDPAALDLIVAVAAFGLAAIDHEVVEQVVVARALPDLRMHDDGAVQADHFVGFGGSGRGLELVVGGDHVAPPGLAYVPLELDAHRAVVPESLDAAVDLAGLKEEPAPLAQRDELVHFHGVHTPCLMARSEPVSLTNTGGGGQGDRRGGSQASSSGGRSHRAALQKAAGHQGGR